jgi:DNA-binding GntR family transcriptional regulator
MSTTLLSDEAKFSLVVQRAAGHPMKRQKIVGLYAESLAAPDSEAAGERAYRRIKGDIQFGHLAPGQKLKLENLRETYAVSVGTLRELLSRLASEGLVTAEGIRGFEVAPVSRDDLKEIAALRLLLESHAIENSFANGNVEWEAHVVAAHHKLHAMESRAKLGDRRETELWKRYDAEFHQALISACGSQILMRTHAGVFEKYLRYQMLALSNRGEIAIREHRTLLEYALKRDAKAASKILSAHIAGGVDHALATGSI